MDLIETYKVANKGYSPFLIREGWQVAQLNYIDNQHISNIDKIEIHRNTDEVFRLLKGKAVLISANIEDEELTFRTNLMQSNSTYNIPKNVWHNIAMEKGSKVLIIEKSNTHLNDVEYLKLKDYQIDELKFEVENVLKRRKLKLWHYGKMIKSYLK